MTDLKLKTWTEITKLSAHLSEGKLDEILETRFNYSAGVGSLTQEQAEEILEALKPITRLRAVLLEGANKTVEYQIDKIAEELISNQVDQTNFGNINDVTNMKG